MESKKLIYADDARRAILEVNPKLVWCIDKLKAVDAVEVVRCKDCKLCAHDKWCERRTLFVFADDFCSYGERKDDER